MTEITDLSTTDSSNTDISGESLNGAIANMGRMDNTLQAVMGLLARSIRTNVMRIIDSTDPTKRIKFNLTGLPTGTERELTAPYYSGTLGLVSDIIGYIRGLTLTNDAGDLTNDIAFAAGSAVDSTGTSSMLLAVGLVKRVDATWVAGTNQGGRFYTTLVDGTIYAYVIRNPTTGVVDCGFSDNASNPTAGASYPSGFTQYVRVGYFARASSVNGIPVSVSQNGMIAIATPQATTSGTSFDYLVPLGVKKITVSFVGVSTNSTSSLLIQIGAGSLSTSGYAALSAALPNGSAVTATTSSSGFIILRNLAGNTHYGSVVLSLENASSGTWCAHGVLMLSDAAVQTTTAGARTLSGSMDRLRITTTGGDTFDSGEINIQYEL